jgi:hypothetical protein
MKNNFFVNYNLVILPSLQHYKLLNRIKHIYVFHLLSYYINDPTGPIGETGPTTGRTGATNEVVHFIPTTIPTSGMVVLKQFLNSTTTSLYDDGQIRIRLQLSSQKMFLTNVNKAIATIYCNIGTLSSSSSSMSMPLTSSFFANFGTSVDALNNKVNVYSNLTTSNNYCMIGYISAPDVPSYGLYDFTFYFNSPLTGSSYSSLVVRYYKTTGITP